MHWLRSSLIDALEPLLLYWLVFGQLLLLYHLLEVPVAAPLNALLLTGVPLLFLLLTHLARQLPSSCLHMSLLMLVLAHLGILLGVMLDFGQQGLLTLAGLCGSLSELSPQLLWSVITTAPWTFAGMVVGSNLGMWLSNRSLAVDIHGARPGMLMYPVCNIGMLAGMVLLEVLVPVGWFTSEPRSGVMVMLLLMLLGMGMGMLFGWWLLGRLSALLNGQGIISHGVTP